MEPLTPAEPATGVLNTFLAGSARLGRQPGWAAFGGAGGQRLMLGGAGGRRHYVGDPVR